MPGYEAAFKYKLIYVMAIHDEAHEGYLKIGEATLASGRGPTQLPPNCDDLNAGAHSRIKEYTRTALIEYELLHTELAVRFTTMQDGATMPTPFCDTDIHDVLSRSGFDCKRFPDTDRKSEWFPVDLVVAISAIRAYKEFRDVLTAAEKFHPPLAPNREIKQTIVMRREQNEAVTKALSVYESGDRMLWDCKMRFGKTVSAYELMRRVGYQKTIVVTHRPVVEEGWRTDHDLVFDIDNPHLFLKKKISSSTYEYDASIDAENERSLRNAAASGVPFVYFASMQDLRGSKLVGGKFDKNNAVFETDWDLVVYDEAHEGTQTDLGQAVQALLESEKNGKKPKVLSLSGTPYNILGQYEENVYTWDYVDEQRRKREYALCYPDEPNPYADLPEMRILTFDLHDALGSSYRYETEDMAFNFREFFRVWTGDPKQDYRPIPPEAQVGDFVHADDVQAFLDLITHENPESHYPFSNPEFRTMFRHTFWMVPGVKEARALSKMLKSHPIFGSFEIANVAGEGDQEQEYDNALKTVKAAIAGNPYTITISCGRLTAGVTVPEWSAVMMLSGSASTAASGYMQTIFRVQSVGSVDGKQKEVAYVFDFAPDRALSVIAEVHDLRNKGGLGESDGKAALGEFLNYCPVIAVTGTQMSTYDVPKMMRQIKRITVDRAIKSGFDDESIYKDGTGIIMDSDDVRLFNMLASKIHGQPKSKLPAKVKINDTGLTNEEYQMAELAKRKPRRQRTLEEEEALRKQREQNAEKEKVIRLLRAVSIRLPMLIYGARKDIRDAIRIEDFIDIVDDESWVEFMPENVSKTIFRQIVKYYDEDVVIGAGLRIRSLARAADELPPTRRVQRIAEIFSLFRNPDKETVLTPWRVVNMHMGDTIGGYNFYDDGYPLYDVIDEPRLIENGDVTSNLILNPDARILELNSKSGLYPLYLAYSLYAAKLPAPEFSLPLEETQRLWRETLADNIYVLCKTKMAQCITRRTLAGYRDEWIVHAIYLTKLLTRMEDKPRLARKLTNPNTWSLEGERMKFDAIVGNPPYQVSDGGSKASATPIYNDFVEQAITIGPRYISMIIPARWYSGGRNLDDFREIMLHDKRICKLHDYVDSNDCFVGVDIAGGLCYFLWDNSYSGKCEVINHHNGEVYSALRDLDSHDVFVRHGQALSIIEKVQQLSAEYYDTRVSSQKPFGLRTYVTPTDEGDLVLRYNQGKGPYKRSLITAGKDWIDKWKVIMSYLTYDHAGRSDREGRRRIFSTMEILGPGEVCTETYVVVDSFDTEKEATNLLSYLKTQTVRFLVAQVTTTQHISKANFALVPIQDFSKSWNDSELFQMYSFTAEEIDFIKANIKQMD